MRIKYDELSNFLMNYTQSQECVNPRYFMGYTRILEDINYNVSVSDVDFDTRGSLYGCGSIDNDLTGNYTLES